MCQSSLSLMSIVNKKFWIGFTDNQERNYITSKIPSKCTPIGIKRYFIHTGIWLSNTRQSKPTIKAKSKSKYTSEVPSTAQFTRTSFRWQAKGLIKQKGKLDIFCQFTREKTCRKNTHSPKIRPTLDFFAPTNNFYETNHFVLIFELQRLRKATSHLKLP